MARADPWRLLVADGLSLRSGRHPLVNPALLTVLFVVAALTATGTRYDTYFAGAQFIHFLLGPATVALGVPLMRNIEAVRLNLAAISVSLMCGSVFAVVSAFCSGPGPGCRIR